MKMKTFVFGLQLSKGNTALMLYHLTGNWGPTHRTKKKEMYCAENVMVETEESGRKKSDLDLNVH